MKRSREGLRRTLILLFLLLVLYLLLSNPPRSIPSLPYPPPASSSWSATE